MSRRRRGNSASTGRSASATRSPRASWSSAEARWTVEVEAGGRGAQLHLRLPVSSCSGYYDYEQGYRPEWPGEADFRGRIVHPQFWPEDLDIAGKSIVVIGSGATAVTLVPALAETAAQVTMLQRSPTYIVAAPVAGRARPLASAPAAAQARRHGDPLEERAARHLLLLARPQAAGPGAGSCCSGWRARALPPGYDVERDFAPRYNPWDQRLCLVPDGDLFAAMKAGKVAVVTDAIERFTADGISLRSGEALPADIVVTATGLVVKLLGGIALDVDGAPVNVADRFSYKGMMLSDVPNLALVLRLHQRLLDAEMRPHLAHRSAGCCRHMDRHGHAICVPRLGETALERQPMLDFSSGYVSRAAPACRAKGRRRPGASTRITSRTSPRCASARSPIGDGVPERRLTRKAGQGT